jgi:hypothetical protein
MNADPRFRSPFPSNETASDTGYRFNLSAQYLPDNLFEQVSR